MQTAGVHQIAFMIIIICHLAYDFHTLEALHESFCRQKEHGAASRNYIKREKKIDLISQQSCPSDSAHE